MDLAAPTLLRKNTEIGSALPADSEYRMGFAPMREQ